jgi:hypothetical protein
MGSSNHVTNMSLCVTWTMARLLGMVAAQTM